jgi:AbiTii
MESLVLQIQRDALNMQVSVDELLRKAKTVAFKLGLEDFLTWIDLELSGYGDKGVPPYREIRGELYSLNPMRGWVPLLFGDQDSRSELSVYKFRGSVTELTDLVSRCDTGSSFAVPYGSMRVAYGPDLTELASVRLQVDRAALVSILGAVRDKIHGWSLALEREGVLGEGISFSEPERKKARGSDVIYQIGHIENFSGVLGDTSGRTTIKSTQTNIAPSLDLEKVGSVLRRIEDHLEELELDAARTKPLRDAVNLAKAELQTRDPDRSKVWSALQTISRICEGAAGSLVAAGIVSLITRLAQ